MCAPHVGGWSDCIEFHGCLSMFLQRAGWPACGPRPRQRRSTCKPVAGSRGGCLSGSRQSWRRHRRSRCPPAADRWANTGLGVGIAYSSQCSCIGHISDACCAVFWRQPKLHAPSAPSDVNPCRLVFSQFQLKLACKMSIFTSTCRPLAIT